MSEQPDEARTAWEEHYGARPQVWSGRVNAQLAAVAGQLTPGRALDLGCGEGADAIWLAEQGWTVTGVDISTIALGRAHAEAERRNMLDRIDFHAQNLEGDLPEGPFDLVSAQFLHSTVPMDRTSILRRVADRVATGGSLLIVDHACAPPWASTMAHHRFPGIDEVLSGLDLDRAQWQQVRVETVQRPVTGPDGAPAVLADNVIWLRKGAGNGVVV